MILASFDALIVFRKMKLWPACLFVVGGVFSCKIRRFTESGSMALAVVTSFLLFAVTAHDENDRQKSINFKGSVSNGMGCLS